MDSLHDLFHHLLHLDQYLVTFVAAHGLWTYLMVFAVIFCETGLIVLPFLPGDSLLFALGSFAAQPQSPLSISMLWLLLVIASILGNQINYWVGLAVGPCIFTDKQHWLVNKKHLEEAHQFYEKHGGKTILLARFIPIIRTFAPFVAGVSDMSRHSFTLYNISSALIWISCLLGMGYFLGSIPFIKEHFSIVIYGIIIVSLIPPVLTYLNHRLMKSS